jgi:hypothetical protein
VTQRGNGRRFILDSDTDRSVYLDLLKQSLTLHADHSSGHFWGALQTRTIPVSHKYVGNRPVCQLF